MDTSLTKILIVDDEKEILAMYTIKLKQAGYTVLTANNGREAFDIASKDFPNLILMDMKMPEVDGITALHNLKNNDTTKDIPVVFVTAFSDVNITDINHEFAAQHGALGYIKKGISLGDFVKEVESYIQKI